MKVFSRFSQSFCWWQRPSLKVNAVFQEKLWSKTFFYLKIWIIQLTWVLPLWDGGGKFENGAVTGAFSALTIAFITDSTFRSNIFNGVKRVSSTIWFGAKILGADFAALGIGQTYGNYTVAKSDLFNLWNAAKSWNVKGISINLFKTIHHIVIPKNGWYGGAGYGLEQFPNGVAWLEGFSINDFEK